MEDKINDIQEMIEGFEDEDTDSPVSEHDASHFESDDDCPACVTERNAWTKE